MPTLFAQRAVLAASLGLGALDVAWLNLVLAPRVMAREPVAAEAPVRAAVAIGNAPPAPQPAIRVEELPAEEAPAVRESRDEVYFQTNLADLDAKARQRIADAVKGAGPDATYWLAGHTDYRGEETYNRQLGRRRASAVAMHLVSLGVERTRVRIREVGVAAPSPEQELWRDRRVEIHITGGLP